MAVRTRTLNFLLVGELRSGLTVVASTLNNRTDVVCHTDVLIVRDDVNEETALRRAAHEAYFGKAKSPDKFPEWLIRGQTNPLQYLSHALFDNPRHGEQAIGARVCYSLFREWELAEFCDRKASEGDFCVIHVRRNPVACFVSQLQAKRTGLWSQPVGAPPSLYPPAVSLDLDELVPFCRQHAATAQQVKAGAGRDLLEIRYFDLFASYQDTMARICDFLELGDAHCPASPGVQRLSNKPLDERISNWDRLQREAPSDVWAYFLAEDFF